MEEKPVLYAFHLAVQAAKMSSKLGDCMFSFSTLYFQKQLHSFLFFTIGLGLFKHSVFAKYFRS